MLILKSWYRKKKSIHETIDAFMRPLDLVEHVGGEITDDAHDRTVDDDGIPFSFAIDDDLRTAP